MNFISYTLWSIAAILIVWFVVLVIKRVKIAAALEPPATARRIRRDPDLPEEEKESGAPELSPPAAEATPPAADSPEDHS